MSRTREASSRGISNFPQDGLSRVRLQAADRNDVDPPAQSLLKQQLDSHEVEQIAGAGQLDEDVDVGVRAGLAACDGTEHADSDDIPLRQLRPQAVEFVQNLGQRDRMLRRDRGPIQPTRPGRRRHLVSFGDVDDVDRTPLEQASNRSRPKVGPLHQRPPRRWKSTANGACRELGHRRRCPLPAVRTAGAV